LHTKSRQGGLFLAIFDKKKNEPYGIDMYMNASKINNLNQISTFTLKTGKIPFED